MTRPLKSITVMVTASGAPGTAALLHALRNNGEREVRLVGTDMSERSVGRHLCDEFHVVPAGSDAGFPAAVRGALPHIALAAAAVAAGVTVGFMLIVASEAWFNGLVPE